MNQKEELNPQQIQANMIGKLPDFIDLERIHAIECKISNGEPITNGESAEYAEYLNYTQPQEPEKKNILKNGRIEWINGITQEAIEKMLLSFVRKNVEETALYPKPFKATSEILQNIKEVSEWLFDTKGKPFLILSGNTGTGKTTIAEAVAKVCKSLDVKKLETTSNSLWDKDDSILNFSSSFKAIEIFEWETNQNNERLYCERNFKMNEFLIIDDLGEEPAEYNNFGTRQTPLLRLLENRYSKKRFTIITTNAGKNGLINHYGERMFDRLKECSKRLTFQSKSFRDIE